jgi:hypothetical protein
VLLALAVVGAAGCSGGAEQRLQTISSWAATARMAADELRARHTTWAYSRKTLAVARERVAKGVKSLKPDDIPPALRVRATGAAAQALDAVDAIDAASERRDERALAAPAARADTAARVLDSLVKLLQGQ